MNPKELSALLLLCITSRVLSLSCLPCDPNECAKPPQGCPAGTTRPVCGCCNSICAQDIGETCGGRWGRAGRCGLGLDCYVEKNATLYIHSPIGTCIETKQACKDAGGVCQLKTDKCGGEMLTGDSFCSLSETYGCCAPKAPACEAPGSGCPNGLCKERCDYENGEYNAPGIAPFQPCGGFFCTCCVAEDAGEVDIGTSAAAVTLGVMRTDNPKVFTRGSERFIVLDEHKGVTWQEANNLCQRSGYELAQPQVDITKLASYLRIKHGLTYYWLGAKGQGFNITYLSGQVIESRSPLWRKAYQGFQTSTDFCVYIRDDGNPNPLGTWSCQDTTYMTPLCEANELVPPPSAASLADVLASSLH